MKSLDVSMSRPATVVLVATLDLKTFWLPGMGARQTGGRARSRRWRLRRAAEWADEGTMSTLVGRFGPRPRRAAEVSLLDVSLSVQLDPGWCRGAEVTQNRNGLV